MKTLDRHKIILIVTIIVSLILGLIAGHEFGDYPYRLCRQNLINSSWLMFGAVSALTLFIGGFIDGLLNRKQFKN